MQTNQILLGFLPSEICIKTTCDFYAYFFAKSLYFYALVCYHKNTLINTFPEETNMSKQALWLIDDAKFHIAGIATSWDYDDRATRSLTDPFPDALVNPIPTKPSAISASFKSNRPAS